MSPAVDILIPQMTTGDATSNHTRLIQELLEERGCEVRIVVERKKKTDSSTLPVEKWTGGARVSILQHSIGSEVAQCVIRNRVPIVLNYHNIHASELFPGLAARTGHERSARASATQTAGDAHPSRDCRL